MTEYSCLPMKTKRKEIDRVNNEFSEFSLSSPARKIRRLDLDLPPIMEEEEDEIIQSAAPVNEERAIVLYNPLQNYQQHYQIVDTDLISGFKKRFLRDASVNDDLYDGDDDDEPSKRQAVVSWEPRGLEITELDGEDEMMEEAAMDVEEASPPQFTGGLHRWQQQQQQQQQVHCMITQLPQTNSTPISWFR